PAQNAVPYAELPELDRYMLHRMSEVLNGITESFDRYQFFKFFQTIQNFCIVDLSNFYFDIAKDRLYISSPNSFRRRSCQTVLAIILENLTRTIAPVLCHMAEDIWQYLPYSTPDKSVFESGWVKLDPQWLQPDLAVAWNKLRDLRTDVNKVMEQARTDKSIGSSLEAKVLLQVQDPVLRSKLGELSFYTTSGATEIQTLPSKSSSLGGVSDSESPTPTIDRLTNSPQLAPVREALQVVTGVFIGLGYAIQKFYNRVQTSLISASILLAALTLIYLGFALMLVINRLPLLGTILEAIGIVMTGVFCYRNLWTSNKRQATFDRIIDYRQTISGKKPTLVKIVDPVDKTQSVNQIVPLEPANLPPQTSTPHTKSNGVDELRYLFLASQVELIDDPSKITGLPHQLTSEGGKIGVVTAEGAKCDRCWNYSPTIGQNSEHPLVCDRCVDALAGDF
ncbi:MAG: hypothetical protein RLZZ135_680, partial [Cyanobacteriota bacterium]